MLVEVNKSEWLTHCGLVILYGTVSSLVLVMAWCLFSFKSPPEPIPSNCPMGPSEQILVKFESKHTNFHSRKCLQNLGLTHCVDLCWWISGAWQSLMTIHVITVSVSLIYLQFNSLRPSDAIWWQRSGSTLAQVMACCLTAPSHYLNQCWLIISIVRPSGIHLRAIL